MKGNLVLGDLSINEWIGKEDGVYVHTIECYSAKRKKKILSFVTT